MKSFQPFTKDVTLNALISIASTKRDENLPYTALTLFFPFQERKHSPQLQYFMFIFLVKLTEGCGCVKCIMHSLSLIHSEHNAKASQLMARAR